MDQLSDAFDAVAAYFSALSEPMRLHIMHRSGVLARRKDGNQVYYRAADAAMVEVCRGVCKRISEQMDVRMPLRRDLLRLLPKPGQKPKARAP